MASIQKVVRDAPLIARALYTEIIMIPVTMLVVISAVPFILSPEEPEKLMVAITLLLSFAVSIEFLSDKLPQTSDKLSALVLYLTALFILSFLGVVANAVIIILKTWYDAHEKVLTKSGSCPSGLLHNEGSTQIYQEMSGNNKGKSRAHRLNRVFLVVNVILLVVISVLA